MKRRLTAEERRLWALVARTVEAAPGRSANKAEALPPPVAAPKAASTALAKAPAAAKPRRATATEQDMAALMAQLAAGGRHTPAPRPAPRAPRHGPEAREPRRLRRLSRERDPIEARIDLHGFGRFEAEDQLRGFLISCQMRGLRSVLVITGQGRRGGGVIRSSVHDWLTGPHLRGVVSGFASAHQRHGGDGALYVTLKPR